MKRERLIAAPQGGRIRVADGAASARWSISAPTTTSASPTIPRSIAAAKTALDEFGFGMASVRFICGAQTLHRELERRIAAHLGKDDAILFAACFDANGGVFEPLLGAEDAIISDALNHASIIDGVRLCKARRYRYANGDMNELERPPEGGRRGGRALQADRHRRRVLDGRRDRQAAGESATSPSATAR